MSVINFIEVIFKKQFSVFGYNTPFGRKMKFKLKIRALSHTYGLLRALGHTYGLLRALSHSYGFTKAITAGAYPRVEHLKSASLGEALALPTNIRLGW